MANTSVSARTKTRRPAGRQGMPVYLRVKEAVQKEIAASGLKPGDRLDTIRALARRHGASTVTMTKVIASLQEQRILRAEQGRGVFLGSPETPSSTCLGFIIPGHLSFDHTFMVEISRGLQEEAAASSMNVGIFRIEPGVQSCQGSDLINKLIEKRVVSGVILPKVFVLPQEYEWIASHRVPYVFLDGYKDPLIWSVDSFPPESYRDILDFLTGMGHRRIAVLRKKHQVYTDVTIGSTLKGNAQMQVSLWQTLGRLWEEYGQRDIIDADTDLLPLFDAVDMDKCVEEVVTWYSAMKHKPTAVFASDDVFAAKLVDRLRAVGIDVPGDVSIMTSGSRSARSELTTWEIPFDQVGRLCVRMLKRQLDGDLDQPRQDAVYGRLRRGYTVKVHAR